ncbi:MAG: DoxX family protein [Planctomycetota bacterium]|nr:DoxX family protein [Planctomycetota bacterium]
MKGVTDIIDVVARVLISAIFLKAAYAKITGFSGTADYMKSNMPFDNDIVVSLLLVGAIILLTVGGISVLIGYKVQAGALLLIIFLVPTTYFFHNFIYDPSQTNAFMKQHGPYRCSPVRDGAWNEVHIAPIQDEKIQEIGFTDVTYLYECKVRRI